MSQDNLFDGINPVYHLINKKKIFNNATLACIITIKIKS